MFILSNRYTYISVTGKNCCRTSNTFELCFQILFFISRRNWIWLLPLKSGRENRKLRSYRVSPHAYPSELVIEFFFPHIQTINPCSFTSSLPVCYSINSNNLPYQLGVFRISRIYATLQMIKAMEFSNNQCCGVFPFEHFWVFPPTCHTIKL